MGNQRENIPEELRNVIVASGKYIGNAMGFFREKMDEALLDGDETTAEVAESLYKQAVDIQLKRNQIARKKIMDSPEIQSLLSVLGEANEELKGRINEEQELVEDLSKITVVLKKLEGGFSKFL